MVKDQGIGMNKRDLNSLFTPYFKTTDQTSTSMNQYSHGIGLHLCKKISTALSGTLTVKSELGMGSTFTFSFKSDLIREPKKEFADKKDIENFRRRIQEKIQKSKKKEKRCQGNGMVMGQIAESEEED